MVQFKLAASYPCKAYFHASGSPKRLNSPIKQGTCQVLCNLAALRTSASVPALLSARFFWPQ